MATIVIALLLALFACLLLAVAFWSSSWPSVKGRIEVSFLDQDTGWKTASGAQGTTVYKKESESHVFAYSYEVRGRKFLGSNIKPWGVSSWNLTSGGDTDVADSGNTIWSGARDDARWYREGAVIDVYFCPYLPQWCCVEPGGFILPVLLLLVSFGIYTFGRR